MRWKRLIFYLLINVVVSAAVTLAVLTIWDYTHSGRNGTQAEISQLPAAMASVIPPTATPTPKPTLALISYEVGPGESLGEIALMFDTTVDVLVRINAIQNPDSLGTGMVLFIPDPAQAENNAALSEYTGLPLGTLTPPAPEEALITVVSVIGAGDLETEHLQIKGLSSEPLSLEGWRLETDDGLIYLFPDITLFNDGAVALYSKSGIDNVVALYWGRPNPTWRTGDEAFIYDAAGNLQTLFLIP